MTAPTPQPPIPKLLRLNGDESESPRAWPGGGVNFEPEKPRDAVSLEPRLMQQLRESETLLAISHRLASSTDIPTVLQQIVDAAAALLGKADRAVLHILEERGDYLNAVTVAGPDRQLIQHPMNFRPGQGIAGLVLLHGKSITVADVRQDPRFVIDNSRAPRIRSLSVAPVILGEKKLGTLSVHSQQTGAFNQHDEHLLTILGSQAALALSKAQMMEAMQQRLNEVNVLYQITEKLLEARQVETALQPIASLLQETFGYYHVGIYLADEERGDLILQAASGEGSRQLEGDGRRVRLGEGIVGGAAARGEVFVSNAVGEEAGFIPDPLLLETNAELAAPIGGGGRTLGVLDVRQRAPRAFQEHDLRLLRAAARHLAAAIERGRSG